MEMPVQFLAGMRGLHRIHHQPVGPATKGKMTAVKGLMEALIPVMGSGKVIHPFLGRPMDILPFNPPLHGIGFVHHEHVVRPGLLVPGNVNGINVAGVPDAGVDRDGNPIGVALEVEDIVMAVVFKGTVVDDHVAGIPGPAVAHDREAAVRKQLRGGFRNGRLNLRPGKGFLLKNVLKRAEEIAPLKESRHIHQEPGKVQAPAAVIERRVHPGGSQGTRGEFHQLLQPRKIAIEQAGIAPQMMKHQHVAVKHPEDVVGVASRSLNVSPIVENVVFEMQDHVFPSLFKPLAGLLEIRKDEAEIRERHRGLGLPVVGMERGSVETGVKPATGTEKVLEHPDMGLR